MKRKNNKNERDTLDDFIKRKEDEMSHYIINIIKADAEALIERDESRQRGSKIEDDIKAYEDLKKNEAVFKKTLKSLDKLRSSDLTEPLKHAYEDAQSNINKLVHLAETLDTYKNPLQVQAVLSSNGSFFLLLPTYEDKKVPKPGEEHSLPYQLFLNVANIMSKYEAGFEGTDIKTNNTGRDGLAAFEINTDRITAKKKKIMNAAVENIKKDLDAMTIKAFEDANVKLKIYVDEGNYMIDTAKEKEYYDAVEVKNLLSINKQKLAGLVRKKKIESVPSTGTTKLYSKKSVDAIINEYSKDISPEYAARELKRAQEKISGEDKPLSVYKMMIYWQVYSGHLDKIPKNDSYVFSKDQIQGFIRRLELIDKIDKLKADITKPKAMKMLGIEKEYLENLIGSGDIALMKRSGYVSKKSLHKFVYRHINMAGTYEPFTK